MRKNIFENRLRLIGHNKLIIKKISNPISFLNARTIFSKNNNILDYLFDDIRYNFNSIIFDFIFIYICVNFFYRLFL